MENHPPHTQRRGWYRPRKLPHFDGDFIQAVTFRLADSLPASLFAERSNLDPETEREKRRAIERALDEGTGEAWLKQPEIADLVANSILHIGATRCEMYAWVVMPTHVHLLFTPSPVHSLANIIKELKSFTALRANRILGREGAFWAKEYFDRFVRDEAHFWAVVEYIHRNPVKAGLCSAPEEWRWSSAFQETGRPEVDLPGSE